MATTGLATSGLPTSGASLVLASNRGPVAYSLDDDGALQARPGSGGLIAGLSASGHDVSWVCAALSDADRMAVRRQRATEGGPGVRMLALDPDVHERAYGEVANRTLWFLHHLLFDVSRGPSFGPAFAADWAAYRQYNEAFADAIAEQAAPGARVLVQDYHLALAPALLRQRRPDVRIGHFSHTPWAPPEYFRLLPDAVAAELLQGMLAADRLGFLSARWADAFRACCTAVLGADGGVPLDVHPLGIDVEGLRRRADEADVTAHLTRLRQLVGDRTVLVRVDRVEPSKNILRGLDAYAELLRRRPDLHGRVVHLAFACPSRSELPEYRRYLDDVRQRAADLSAEFARPDWQPLHLEIGDDLARSLAAFRLADVVLTNPVRDGMNLVAKEAPALSDSAAVLVLSREAGAADELGADALLVNPFDVGATADALAAALTMAPAERRRRWERLVTAAGACPPDRWLQRQVAALSGETLSG